MYVRIVTCLVFKVECTLYYELEENKSTWHVVKTDVIKISKIKMNNINLIITSSLNSFRQPALQRLFNIRYELSTVIMA